MKDLEQFLMETRWQYVILQFTQVIVNCDINISIATLALSIWSCWCGDISLVVTQIQRSPGAVVLRSPRTPSSDGGVACLFPKHTTTCAMSSTRVVLYNSPSPDTPVILLQVKSRPPLLCHSSKRDVNSLFVTNPVFNLSTGTSVSLCFVMCSEPYRR